MINNLWAAEWYSKNNLGGITRHIIYNHDCFPALFHTRRECREFIKSKYGYIAERDDLQREPHGWRIPKPVKVEIVKTN